MLDSLAMTCKSAPPIFALAKSRDERMPTDGLARIPRLGQMLPHDAPGQASPVASVCGISPHGREEV